MDEFLKTVSRVNLWNKASLLTIYAPVLNLSKTYIIHWKQFWTSGMIHRVIATDLFLMIKEWPHSSGNINEWLYVKM